MAAFADLVLQNEAAENVTFKPSKIDTNGVAIWKTSDSVLDARKTASLQVREPKGGSSVYRVTGKVVVPVMDTVDATVKVGEIIADVSFAIPKIATQTHRLDARKMIDTFVSHATISAAVSTMESVY